MSKSVTAISRASLNNLLEKKAFPRPQQRSSVATFPVIRSLPRHRATADLPLFETCLRIYFSAMKRSSESGYRFYVYLPRGIEASFTKYNQIVGSQYVCDPNITRECIFVRDSCS